MKIDLFKNKIVIEYGQGELKDYQKSQFSYFDFELGSKKIEKISDDFEKDLQTISQIAEYGNLNIEYGKTVKRIVQNIKDDSEKFLEIKKRGENFKNGIFEVNLFNEFELFLKNNLRRRLRPHQIKAAYHHYIVQNAANFSVPGSGKTSVILAVYEKLRLEGKVNCLFVIGPYSSFEPWKVEFSTTLNRNPNFRILSGGDPESRRSEFYVTSDNVAELYMTSFHSALNDSEYLKFFLRKIGLKVCLVVDEAHYFKRVGGAWANTILGLKDFADHKFILTGTPAPKSYTDFFNLFDFLWGNRPVITEEQKIQIQLWEKEKENEKIKNLLDEQIGPFFYRVRKSELGLKSPEFHDPILIEMKPIEKRINSFIKSRIETLSESDFFENEKTLEKLWKSRMIRLRQSCSNSNLLKSALIEENNEFQFNEELTNQIINYKKLETPRKLDALLELVSELNRKDEKVVIWTNFIGTLKLIKESLSEIGIKSELIYGDTPKESFRKVSHLQRTREEIIETFKNRESSLDVLVANPAACAESISLHKTCNHAIYYDLSYNLAQYLQSLDRIHRVGGSEKKEANYYFLKYENSIDEDIFLNLQEKAKKMYNIIDQDYEVYDLTIEEEGLEDIDAYKRLFLNK